MLKLAPVFLVLAIIFGIYSVSSVSVFPKVITFVSVVLLFLSLLGKKRMA
jgi:hypothetical protein